MIGWLWRVLIGRFTRCRHEWEIVNRVSVMNPAYKQPTSYEYHLQCTQCGDLTCRKL